MKIIKLDGSRGFSLLEVLIVISVLGIVSAAAVAFVSNGTLSGSREVRIHQEERTLNSAVAAYLASGGDLSEAKSAGEVLAKLKTRASQEQRRRIPGLSGSFIDPAVEFEMQSPREAKSGAPRLRWDPESLRFELARSGEAGIASLVARRTGMDDHESTGPQTEDRRQFLSYSAESAWIWDYQDSPVGTPIGASEIPTGMPVDSIPPSSPSPLVNSVARQTLLPPSLSLPGGRYPQQEFNLELTISDPNATGTSQVYYSVNYGNWSAYAAGSTLSVAPDSSIKAQAIPFDSETWEASSIAEELYHAYLSYLRPPTIDFDEPYFESTKTKTVSTIRVELSNPNNPSFSKLLYQIVPVPRGDGPVTEFQPYSGPFDVSVSTYPQGFGVRAFASATVVGYEDSRVAARFATARTDLYGGHLDLDTATFIAEIGKGKTDAHTHDILAKIGGMTIDFFAIPESKQIEITEAIPDPAQKFKITAVNAELSPGISLVIEYELGGVAETLDLEVSRYDDIATEDLTVFTLGGMPGSAKLTGLRLQMNQDLIYQASMLPSNTGDVVGNVLGKDGEWRNGALCIQALAVNADGSPAYATSPSLSNGAHGAATSGLFWEAILFWHWSGDSYHKEKNQYIPRNFNSIRLYVKD